MCCLDHLRLVRASAFTKARVDEELHNFDIRHTLRNKGTKAVTVTTFQKVHVRT